MENIIAIELTILHNLLDLIIGEADENIFWFEICVNDLTNSVKEIKTNKNLSGHFSNSVQRKTFIVSSLEHLQQIDSQNFINHTEMIAIGSLVKETVQQVQHMSIISVDLLRFLVFVFANWTDPFRTGWKLCDFLQNLHLVVRSIEIVRSRFHDLNSYVSSIFEILGEPHSGEVSPSQFLNEHIPVDKHFTDVARVVSANLVIFNAFVLTVVFFVELLDPVFEILGMGVNFFPFANWEGFDLVIDIEDVFLVTVLLVATTCYILIILIIVIEAFIWS